MNVFRSFLGSSASAGDESSSPAAASTTEQQQQQQRHQGELPSRVRARRGLPEDFNVLVIEANQKQEVWRDRFRAALKAGSTGTGELAATAAAAGGGASAAAATGAAGGGEFDNDDDDDDVDGDEAAVGVVNVGGKPRRLRVWTSGWDNISITSYARLWEKSGVSETKAMCEMIIPADPRGGDIRTRSQRHTTFTVHFVLVRNQVVGALPSQNYKSQLMAMMHAGVPSINSLSSIFLFTERTPSFGELLRLRGELGADAFPVIDQTFYPSHREMVVTPDAPFVLKVGHAHAGFGGLQIRHHHDMADVRGVLAMTGLGASAESFVADAVHDLRIQRIGDHTRVFKRIGLSGSWKTNTGAAIIEDIELAPDSHYVFWADQCAKLFGGLDLFALDALVAPDGTESILELNDTAIGLSPDHEEDDSVRIAQLSLERIMALPAHDDAGASNPAARKAAAASAANKAQFLKQQAVLQAEEAAAREEREAASLARAAALQAASKGEA